MRRYRVASCVLVGIWLVANISSQAPDSEPKRVVTSREKPSRVSSKLRSFRQTSSSAGAMAFDGKELWVFLYAAGGRYAKFDPTASTWDLDADRQIIAAVNQITGSFGPSGAAFVGDSMWLVAAHDTSFGSIDRQGIRKAATARREEFKGQQHFSDVTFDGERAWAAWKSLDYGAEPGKNQLLRKLDKGTGEILTEFPLPFGWVGDGARGLTRDGKRLW